MLELQTIKTDFLFKNSQDFNQTTHARPQHPIVFIHNISLYFNCISSVKYLFKWSHHGHVMPFSCSTTQAQTQKIEYAYFERQEKCLRMDRNASFLLFLHFKIATFEKRFEADSERSYFKVFCMLYHFAIILKQL